MKTMMWMWMFATVAGTGCTDLGSPAVLDRPRVLAVRAEPPHIAAGASARIDVLVGDAAGGASVTVPAEVIPAVDVPGVVHHDPIDGWTITAPPEDALAAMRTQLGLAPGAPIELPLSVTAEVDGELLAAIKVVVLGSTAVNPMIDGMTLGDTGPASPVAVPVGDVALAPGAVTATGELAYAWYTSIGELADYRSERATLTATEPGLGQLVLVVRDDQFGVGWTMREVQIE